MMKIDESVFFTEADIESLARECALVERKSPITGFKFLLTFTTGLLHTPDGEACGGHRTANAFVQGLAQPKVDDDALQFFVVVTLLRRMENWVCVEHGRTVSRESPSA